MTPKIAIITRTQNRHLLLSRTIQSVLSQTEAEWVHVIVNDGGDREGLDAFLLPYHDRYAGRLTVVHHPKPLGRWTAANTGVQASNSKYICILDDDDSWDPTFLTKMTDALTSEKWPDTKGIFCHTVIVKEKIDDNRVIELGREDFNQWLPALTFFDLMAWNRFVPVGFLFEREVFDKIGFFDETLPVIGDWEFHIRFLSEYEIAVLPENLAFWHQRPESEDAYKNSVGNRNNHLVYRAHLVNRWARQSLKNGTLGYGDAFGFSLAGELHHRMYHTDRQLDRTREALGRIEQNQQPRNLSSRLDELCGTVERIQELQQAQNQDSRLDDLRNAFNIILEYQNSILKHQHSILEHQRITNAETIRAIVQDVSESQYQRTWSYKISRAIRRLFFLKPRVS